MMAAGRDNIVWLLLALLCRQSIVASALSTSAKIRAISFDVTGTLLATREPVIKSYHDAALWARLPDPPTQTQLKDGFKIAFRERCIESPCFGGVEGISGREWWRETVGRVLHHAKPDAAYTEEEFDRYFRRVYQHFGSPGGYRVLEDAQCLLDTLEGGSSDDILLGITSNTPTRHMESVLPMLDSLHDRFSWFACSQDVRHEKPAVEIFDASFRQALFWIPDLQKEEILHIGDSYECDYCGARRYGFQALLLDRSDNPSVQKYQDWMEAVEYEGKSLEDVSANTITSLEEVAKFL
ncbi:hypothetical protein ACHAXT_009524 [Thalassiosira profunda]